MTKTLDTKGVLYVRKMPSEVKRRFKTWCAENEVVMADIITVILTMIVNDPRGKFAREALAEAKEDE
jgi:hypothetical protein